MNHNLRQMHPLFQFRFLQASGDRLGLIWGVLIAACLLLLLFVPAAQAQDTWDGKGSTLSLKVGEAKFIRLQQPAKSVFLSNPAVADIDLQSARSIYIVGHSLGTTNLYVLGQDDKPLVKGTVHVDLYLDRIQAAVSAALKTDTVHLSTVDGAVFLNGTVDTEEDARRAEDVVGKLAGDAATVVNNLTLTTPSQVNLRVTIAEVSRKVQQDLGISLSGTVQSGRRSIGAPGSSTNGYSLSVKLNGGNLNLSLNALAESGLASILSEPNLTARSGEKATFLAGGRVPIRIGATQEDTRVSFENIGVELNFTPTVFKQNRIQIQLDTSVRQIDAANSTANTPAFTERSASTTVELGSGQSFAIAGMFGSNRQQTLSEFPGLGKIPILGALFRSSSYQKGESELVIIVTPYVVRPTDRKNLATPLDTLRPVDNGITQMATGQMERPLVKLNGANGRSGATFLMNR
ncbi:type II and III secretion system protein family protein [Thioclava electrotropha]|uniref:Type II and III secretion system protein family protein n=1 Tax=Thioclava electrotropha TaxID=1549850 RepID=A0ABX6YZN9_9RHOB|nr:type II and III secretion system protein family protein [Thioclava electrotropha]QPZ93354.1 type II and III secretion system protein family protein [Thioclava electrotropha]